MLSFLLHLSNNLLESSGVIVGEKKMRAAESLWSYLVESDDKW